MILGVAVGSFYLSLRPNPDGWINGPWRGTIRIDSTPHAEHELHRAGTLALVFRAENGFSFDEHQAEGEMTLSRDAKPYALGLYEIKLLSKERKSNASNCDEEDRLLHHRQRRHEVESTRGRLPSRSLKPLLRQHRAAQDAASHIQLHRLKFT